MITEYSISDILGLQSQFVPYHGGTFEDTKDPEIEWPHRHTFFSLVWFTGGSGFYVIDFDEYEIKPNRVFFVSPKQVHNWDYSENSKGYFLTIDNSLEKELNLNYLSPYLDISSNKQALLEAVFCHLIENLEKKTDIKIDIQYIHRQIKILAEQKDTKYYTTNSYIILFKKLIIDTSQILSIENYAKKMDLSVDQLSTLCKEQTGVSPKQYLMDIIVTEAKYLLLYSEHNINEIAFKLGFDDSSYFSRVFKKKTMYSPSDFLKKYRK